MGVRRFFSCLVFLLAAGCGQPPAAETVESWDGLQSAGWYAVDKSEWNDCAVSVEHLAGNESGKLKLTFDMQDAAHATWRNPDLTNRDWTGYRALLLDFENSLEKAVQLIVYLSNQPDGDRWGRSVRHTIPAGKTSDLRVDLVPSSNNKVAPRDWDESAWQFKGIRLDDIQRIAISVKGETGLQGSITISNPRIARLAR